MACSFLSVYVIYILEILITFASEIAGSRDDKIVILSRIFYCLICNYTFFNALKVLDMEL
jgi:hypothetical protein